MRNAHLAVLAVLAVFAPIVLSPNLVRGQGETLPLGFTLEPVIVDIFEPGRPVGFAQLPDGRFLILERNTGHVRLHPVGGSTAPVIHTVANVTTQAERGLLGVAVDPDWPSRPYVYLFFTHTGSVAYLRMVRAEGDLTDPESTNLSFVDPFELLTDLPDLSDIHNGGTLRFGLDGMLYLSLGDDANVCHAQSITTPAGGLLRLDVSSMPGSGPGPPAKSELTPADNPFSGPDDVARLVWVWGLRNPYRFTIDSETNDLVIGDVGLASFEEVDIVPFSSGGGQNFGWPHLEGLFDPNLGHQCGIDNEFSDPSYVYAHGAGASVIAGPVYRAVPGADLAYPASYHGIAFVMEFWQGWIRRLSFDGSAWQIAPAVPGQPSATNWAESFHYFADFQLGADGSLYLLRLIPVAGRPSGLYRVAYSPPVAAPLVASGASAVDPYPNPFVGSAEVRWLGLPAGKAASIRILDATGRLVRTIEATSGREARWDGRNEAGQALGAGVYFYRAALAGSVHDGKIVRVR